MALGLGKRLVPRDRGDHLQPTAFTNQIGVAGIADLVGDAHDFGGPPAAACQLGESSGGQERLGRRLDDVKPAFEVRALQAVSDLGARAGFTFRRVVLPLVLPAVVAGSIFTFSLTLGDYITPQLVSNTKLIGNAIYDTLGVPNLPLAAAIATVPVVIVVLYLLAARRTGAFESL